MHLKRVAVGIPQPSLPCVAASDLLWRARDIPGCRRFYKSVKVIRFKTEVSDPNRRIQFKHLKKASITDGKISAFQFAVLLEGHCNREPKAIPVECNRAADVGHLQADVSEARYYGNDQCEPANEALSDIHINR